MAGKQAKKGYSKHAFINKMKRLTGSLEAGEAFLVQVRGQRVRVPAKPEYMIEYSTDGDENVLQFELRWE